MNPEQAYTIAQFVLSQIEQEWKTTHRVLAAVPDDTAAGYKPSDKCMSGQELTAHIAFTDAWFLESVIKGAFDRPDDSGATAKKPSELAAEYQERMPGLIEQAKQLTGEKLAEPIQFYSWTMPGVQYLVIALKHGIHHRGQLSAYLRPMGAKVPSIYGASADDKPATATQNA